MAGKLSEFVNRVLETVPEDQREVVRSLYSQAQDEIRASEEFVGRVRATADQQKSWWEQNKPKVDEYDRLKAEGKLGTPQVTQPTNQITDAVTRDLLTKETETLKNDILDQGLALATLTSAIVASHVTEFPGERLDMQKLIADAIAAKKPLDVFYNEQVAPKRAERETAARAKEIAEAEARGAQKAKDEFMTRNAQLPYPVGQTQPTTLSGLRKPEGDGGGAKNDYSLEAAVATANEVLQRQAGA